jgi:hypothetical protein
MFPIEETVLDALTAIRMQRSLGSRAIGRGPVDTVPMPFEVYQALKRYEIPLFFVLLVWLSDMNPCGAQA